MSRPLKTAWRFAVNLVRLKNFGLALWATQYELAPGHDGSGK